MGGEAVTATSNPGVEVNDIQGVVASGYGHLPVAQFVLLHVRPSDDGRVDGAKAWLARVAARVTDARGRKDDHSTNLAITHHGLLALRVRPDVANAFAAEFISGMATPDRSRALGDTGVNAPERWAWGGASTTPIDLVLMLYATDAAALDRLARSYLDDLATAQLVEVRRLTSSMLSATEPFGFADGRSQPSIDGVGPAGLPADTVQPGEFLLGYPNEYGQFAPSPLVAAAYDPGGLLAVPGRRERDLGRNGTYLVLRELSQDVDGFWAFLTDATRRPDGSADRDAATYLAAKMVGRWPSGAPLVLAPYADDPALAANNDFAYFAEDRDGLRCPVAAHIRRANPRDSLPPKPGTDASVAVGKRHRIIRRGRARGSLDGTPVEPGLYFVGLNASLRRQFEFIQGTWCGNPNFEGLYDEPDPIISTRSGRSFRIPDRPVRRRVRDLPAFVTVQGGGYFFLPGLRALQYIARSTP
jgi:Dyp-type peroxidase family